MNHEVLIPFIDEVSDKFILPGTSFTCDDYKRVNKLHELGFIRKNDESEKLKKPSTANKAGAKDASKG